MVIEEKVKETDKTVQTHIQGDEMGRRISTQI